MNEEQKIKLNKLIDDFHRKIKKITTDEVMTYIDPIEDPNVLPALISEKDIVVDNIINKFHRDVHEYCNCNVRSYIIDSKKREDITRPKLLNPRPIN